MDDIQSYALPIEGNWFEALFKSVRLGVVGKGRQGAVLTQMDQSDRIPIVRTTTRYSTPAQPFQPIHQQLAQQIQSIASLPVGFNNALIECYTNAYAKMGAHSDQALDLADESFIAIFSCYKYPEPETASRKLLVTAKEAERDRLEIPLTHNGVVVFSVQTNRRLKHKIVLDKRAQIPENRWLGITFRTAKTWVQFRNDQAHFLDGAPLTLANEEQKQEFYHLRRRENQETDFTYPRILYTLSQSDLMPPHPNKTEYPGPIDRTAQGW